MDNYELCLHVTNTKTLNLQGINFLTYKRQQRVTDMLLESGVLAHGGQCNSGRHQGCTYK